MIGLIGREVRGVVDGLGRSFSLFAAAMLHTVDAWRSRRNVCKQLELAGFGSILVLALISGLTGMIMVVQTGSELVRFGIEDNLGAIIAATFLREMGPLWAAVIVLARVGGSMAAELGTMAVNDEVEALDVMGINPKRYLVMPRLLALLIAMPLLTALADFVGLASGMLVAQPLFGVLYGDYLTSAKLVLEQLDLWSGLFKSLVFAAIIGTIACDQGLNTTNGAEGVGRATTRTVVIGLVAVLTANLIISTFVQMVLRGT